MSRWSATSRSRPTSPADAQDELVSHVDGLPEGGSTDDLAIRGDCEALYLHTGDQYEPWVPVEERDKVWRFKVTGDLVPGKVKILDVSGAQRQSVWLDVREDRLVRSIIYKGDESVRGDLFEIPTDGAFALGIRNLLDSGLLRVPDDARWAVRLHRARSTSTTTGTRSRR